MKTTLQIYNTLTRKIEDFKPQKKTVTLYTCGPTVYNFAHIGNLRAFVSEDILKRVLNYNGYPVKHVMNITDVGHLTSDADEGEDKMEKGAAREGKNAWEIAKFYTEAFFEDIRSLNILPADVYPRVTDHITEQIELIEELERKGFTYRTEDGIYFDSTKLKDYGKLAELHKQSLEAGARVELGQKKNPTDFALWKFSPKDKERQMEWPSPWGTGFPGWHIECSAMSVKYLGQPIDIHGGGVDHIPVHHTNEIAQTEAATGKPLANYWMHGEFLLIGSDKMAKSGNNFITLQTLKDKGFSPLAYRYFLLQAHYRKQLSFSYESLQAAQTGLNRLYQTAYKLKINAHLFKDDGLVANEHAYKEEIEKQFNNDLNTPNAIGLIWEGLKSTKISYKTLLELDNVLGLDIRSNVEEIERDTKEQSILPEIKELIVKRDEARAKKDWEASDRIREELEDKGYAVEDTKDGTKVKKLR